MTFVSTVSSGTYGTYEPYDFTIPSYDTDSRSIDSFERSRVGFGKSYEGTGGTRKSALVAWPGVYERTLSGARAGAHYAAAGTHAGVGG